MTAHKKQIIENINQTIVLKELMTAYEEIAAKRMQRIREQVLKSREFHELLRGYFHEIQTSHSHEKPTQTTQVSVIKNNGKNLILLASDDKGLYGDILEKTQKAFIAYAQKDTESDLAVLGNLGAENLQHIFPNRQLRFFPLADGNSVVTQINDVLRYLTDYTNVTVFHGKFLNLVTQEPEQTHLGGDAPLVEQEKPSTPRRYVFEPSRDSLLTFFRQEILAVLFDQTMLESNLAKQASRMISLEKASDEAKKRIIKLKKLEQIMRSQTENKRQITYLAGLSLWKIH